MSELEQVGRINPLDQWVSAGEAMQLLGVSRSWLKHLRECGAIEARNRGYGWLYFIPSLEAYRREHPKHSATKGK